MEEKGGDQLDRDLDPKLDLEFVSCLLQPPTDHNDPDYVGIRRLLLARKPQIQARKEWRCNGRGYVAYRNFIRRPRNWDRMLAASVASTPNHSCQAELRKRDDEIVRIQTKLLIVTDWTSIVNPKSDHSQTEW